MEERKTKLIRVYELDKDILKKMNSPTIAEAVHTMIHGNHEKIKEMVEVWGSEFINPKIEQIRKTLSEQISIEIERRFKELGSK